MSPSLLTKNISNKLIKYRNVFVFENTNIILFLNILTNYFNKKSHFIKHEHIDG